MTNTFQKAMTLSLLIASATMSSLAQSAAVNSPSLESRVSDDSTATADKRSSPSATATKPELKPDVDEKIDLLQKQIDELQSELKAVRASARADKDSSELKTAENTLVAG